MKQLRNILYVNKYSKNLKRTFQGMIELLENPVQFREFGEFCINENCPENIVIINYQI